MLQKSFGTLRLVEVAHLILEGIKEATLLDEKFLCNAEIDQKNYESCL